MMRFKLSGDLCHEIGRHQQWGGTVRAGITWYRYSRHTEIGVSA